MEKITAYILYSTTIKVAEVNRLVNATTILPLKS